jgi:hypothetical protein
MARPRIETHHCCPPARWPRQLRGLTLAVAALSPWMSGGCRAVDNAQVDVMERELRQQEDYIYELEDYLIEYSEKLRECRTCPPSSATTRSSSPRRGILTPTLADDRPSTTGTAQGGNRQPSPPIDDPAPPIDPPAAEPEAELPSQPDAEPFSPEDLEAPDLEIGPSAAADQYDASPIATTPPGDEAPPYIPDPADYQLDVDAADVAAAPAGETPPPVDASADVATGPSLAPAGPIDAHAEPARLAAQQLVIRKLFSEPASDDGSTPASLLVVVEAVNATNEPVDANGEISLMVMTGESQESLQRVERWDFTAEETQAAWQSSHLGDGLHLQLPLTNSQLPEGPLQLFAKLVNQDGEKLLARVSFQAGELTSMDAVAPAAVATEEVTPAVAEEEVAYVQPPKSAAQSQLPAPLPAATKWRASSEARLSGPSSGTNSAPKTPTGWMRQPPGGRAPFATPQTAAGGDGRDWQPFR